MAETEGGVEIEPFLDAVDATLGPSASFVPVEARHELSRQLMESSHLISQQQCTIERLSKQIECYRRIIVHKDESSEVKDSEIAVLKTKLKKERAEKDSLKTSKSALEDSYKILLERNNRLDDRELMRRLEEKFPLFICKLVPGLVLNMSFGKTFTLRKMMHHVKEAMKVIHEKMNPSGVAHLTSDAALELVRKALPSDFEYPNLDVLLAALIAKDNPLTLNELVDFDNYLKRMKNIGNEEAHGTRPEPYQNLDSSIVNIRNSVFGGSEDNALFIMIKEWAAVYKSKWPFNTPTSMQQRSGWTPNQTPTQTPSASQSASAPASRRSANTGPAGTGMNPLGLASSIACENAATVKAAESNIEPRALDYSQQTSSSLSPRPVPSGSGLSSARSQGNQRLLATHPNSQNKKTLASRIHQPLVNARASISSWRKNAREPKRNARKRNKEDDWNERSRKRHKGDSR